MAENQPYVTIRSRQPVERFGARSATSAVQAAPGTVGFHASTTTHDISRTSFHVKHIGQFARRLEDSAARAFPNRGRSSQRYKKVQALLLHWNSDDLFVIPELEDLEKCLREDYSFNTDIFGIPSENSHLELMLRIGQLIKDFESPDTLFLIYYGGHARIDESRQSTWCATRDAESPWLQWSAIQTLLERSKSDVLILLDCCAGAASATFPSGTSITETISASSWDAIAPDPGRYSFTNALIEVLQEWRVRMFSAAMLHAEVLARLKHPRPITINGKLFEARSTPVHFMMTSNHKAPSIEISRTIPEDQLPPSPQEPFPPSSPQNGRGYPDMGRPDMGRAGNGGPVVPNDYINTEPNEDTPHVMISLALEDDQRLDINAWEQWIAAFPALAKYVKVQGVFKSHSTLLLVSMPVTIWDMLPEDHATSFVAFIRSNNLAAQKPQAAPLPVAVRAHSQQNENMTTDTASFMSGVSGTTFTPTENSGITGQMRGSMQAPTYGRSAALAGPSRSAHLVSSPRSQPSSPPQNIPMRTIRSMNSATSLPALQGQQSSSSLGTNMSRQMIINQQQAMRRTTFGDNVPEPKKFSPHVERRLEEYYQHEPLPNDGQKAFFASNLGVEPWHIEVWFHHRRERDAFAQRFASLRVEETKLQIANGPRMILPANLNELLNISRPDQILLFDLRAQTYYQRSHIRGAINLRAPQSFIRPAALEMVERAFTDEQSRKAFSSWNNARCVVFYARGLESLIECPSAMVLLEKFRAEGWAGHCFILKGHYREFSESYGSHILKDSSAAQVEEDTEKSTTPVQESSRSNEAEYAELISRLEQEDQLRHLGTSPSQLDERTSALQDQEAELEAEFKTRHSDLYNKAQEVHGGRADDADSFVTKAQMVEYLDRGLTKIRDAQSVPTEPTYEPGHSKLADDCYFNRTYVEREADDFVEVGRGEEQAPGDSGKGKETRAAMSPDEIPRRGRGGILNKVFRRT